MASTVVRICVDRSQCQSSPSADLYGWVLKDPPLDAGGGKPPTLTFIILRPGLDVTTSFRELPKAMHIGTVSCLRHTGSKRPPPAKPGADRAVLVSDTQLHVFCNCSQDKPIIDPQVTCQGTELRVGCTHILYLDDDDDTQPSGSSIPMSTRMNYLAEHVNSIRLRKGKAAPSALCDIKMSDSPHLLDNSGVVLAVRIIQSARLQIIKMRKRKSNMAVLVIPTLIMGWLSSTLLRVTHRLSEYSAAFRQINGRLMALTRIAVLLELVQQDREFDEDSSAAPGAVPNECMFRSLLISEIITILLDTLLGAAFATIIANHQHDVLKIAQRSTSLLTIDSMRMLVEWLTGIPAGFKLNDKLDYFLASLMYQLLSACELMYNFVKFLNLPVVPVLLILSTCGISILAGALMDILSFVSLHPFLMSLGMCHIISPFMRCVGSLWLLFHGRKMNILKKRTDTLYFTTFDQLLIGSMLFPCIALLSPTVILFYLTSNVSWLTCLAFYVVLQYITPYHILYYHHSLQIDSIDPQATQSCTYWSIRSVKSYITYRLGDHQHQDITIKRIVRGLITAKPIYPQIGLHKIFESVYNRVIGQTATEISGKPVDHVAQSLIMPVFTFSDLIYSIRTRCSL